MKDAVAVADNAVPIAAADNNAKCSWNDKNNKILTNPLLITKITK